MPDPKVGHFYVMTADAKVIFGKIFKAQVIPGKAIVVSDEDFATLRDGVRSYPVMVMAPKPSGLVVPLAN